jgi:hypothetical protein
MKQEISKSNQETWDQPKFLLIKVIPSLSVDPLQSHKSFVRSDTTHSLIRSSFFALSIDSERTRHIRDKAIDSL